MLRYSFVLLAGMLAASPVVGATWADGMFDELNKDFGPAPRGPALTHQFRFVNNTKGQVVVGNIRVSCGCTTATATKTLLNPGEEAHIVAHMDTTRFTGMKNVTIYVPFLQPAYEEVRLWVQANGRDDFSMTPDILAFGQVRRGAAPQQSNTITFLGNGQFAISDVRTESTYIKAAVKEVRRQPTEVVYQLTASMQAETPAGKWYSDIWLTTNNPGMPRIRVPITVEIESNLTVSPDHVAWGPVRVAEASTRRVIVRGLHPFKITGIEGSDGVLKVEDGTTDAKEVHVLTLKLKPDAAGDLNRTVKLLTDLKAENTIAFKVQAQVVP